ncbi:hypothetical protein DSO57_1025301 [Entomophthora muscae]|uniref:Uncharacterized protein n=1 Tax=Entomophthora muscae TaxID=34485 RepID=A0ACC2S4G3_9FUNG|nr:hypothetical protein DSO57_1025301 [Entomophthora muscae]
MTPPLTLQPDCPIETPTAGETTSTQLFGVLYITLTGMVDSMVPNSGPWSLLVQSISYIIKLAPILWWALPTGPSPPHPEPPNASTYAWFPGNKPDCIKCLIAWQEMQEYMIQNGNRTLLLSLQEGKSNTASGSAGVCQEYS